MHYTEQDLDELSKVSIKESELAHVTMFRATDEGFKRIMYRVKQHILIRGIDNVDTAIALVDNELQEPYIETK